MDIKTRYIGSGKTSLIEVTVTDRNGNSSITEEVTNLQGKVDGNFIFSLREVADELEEHNLKHK